MSAAFSVLTICGIEELPDHCTRGVTHVLSLLDPGWPEIDSFAEYGAHKRATFHFHDTIEPLSGRIMPTRENVAEILRFGADLETPEGVRGGAQGDGHLLVHCHMGVSRSTAAMLSLLAQSHPEEREDRLFARLREIRPQAWPNSVMIGHADDLLGRQGRLVEALREHYSHRIQHDPEVIEWMTRLGRRREVEMAVRP